MTERDQLGGQPPSEPDDEPDFEPNPVEPHEDPDEVHEDPDVGDMKGLPPQSFEADPQDRYGSADLPDG